MCVCEKIVVDNRPAAAQSWVLILSLVVMAATNPMFAADPSPTKPAATDVADKPIPLNPAGTVQIDVARKRLLVKSKLCVRRGPLEMLVCKANSKEHESILSVDADAYVIHAGLLALGAKTGTTVQFDPKFQPPTGQKIEIFVNWTDEEGMARRENAKSWVRRAVNRYYLEKDYDLPAGVDDLVRRDDG